MSTKHSFTKLGFLMLAFLCLANLKGFAQENQPFSINESPLPAPTGPVMDYAGVMDAGAKQALEKRLIEFRDRTNPKVELAVAVVNTTGDRPIFDYSLAVARGWKIGTKEDDNPSALLFIAIQDRKYFTQVSKDLEDELPDGIVGQIQRQYLVPAFRQQNYTKGVTDTMDAFIRTIETRSSGTVAEQPTNPTGTGTTQQPRKRAVFGGASCGLFICLGVIFLIFLAGLSRKGRGSGKDNDRWRGGGFGGGGGSVLPWIIGSAIANSIGNSSSSSWGSGGSSDWGGSSGGDSWGGFGGGGDFGGGGAGGDW